MRKCKGYFLTGPKARSTRKKRLFLLIIVVFLVAMLVIASPMFQGVSPLWLCVMGLLPGVALLLFIRAIGLDVALKWARSQERKSRYGKLVLGAPPQRSCFQEVLKDCQDENKAAIDCFLLGFELESGSPIWIEDDEICGHACVISKSSMEKTRWLESLVLQQMARGGSNGCTFIDSKKDSSSLARIVLMAIATGRIDDLIVIDPSNPMHFYNFVLTDQKADLKAHKVLRTGLAATLRQSEEMQLDRLANDPVYRLVRTMDSSGLAWSLSDIASAISAFDIAYPKLRTILHKIGAKGAMVELGHLAASYKDPNGKVDVDKITNNLRGIAVELRTMTRSDEGRSLCRPYTDLVLTDAILRGKIIYFYLPDLQEAENSSRFMKMFKEDLEVSIKEIAATQESSLRDPYLVILDESPAVMHRSWASLFEMAKKARFAFVVGMRPSGEEKDELLGLDSAFYEHIMAKVKLRVLMRIGETRPSRDISDWIQRVCSPKKTAKGANAARLKIAADSAQKISFAAENEDGGASPEEENPEIGLAYFDRGTQGLVKGRCFYFEAETPEQWTPREYITDFEKHENDELGLANWVDKEIFAREKEAVEKQKAAALHGFPHPNLDVTFSFEHEDDVEGE